MKDTDLYAQIFGLCAPWFVSKVSLEAKYGQVDVYIEHSTHTRWTCPVCGRELSCYDHAEERTWRHLDTCQFKTFLHARVPRVNCPEHGVIQVSVPWAESKGRFTLLMERLIIDLLNECATVTGACRIARISWDECWGVMERAVRRGQKRKESIPHRYIGVDEKAFLKGHNYMTVVCNLTGGNVEYVSDDRKIESLEEYYNQFTTEQLERIKAISMDMWEPYFAATRKHVPDATNKIVYDRFHIMKHVCEAVNHVRKTESRELSKNNDRVLIGTKYLWLYREKNIPENYRVKFDDLKALNLKVARAWAMKESLISLWNYSSQGWAKRFLQRWITWVNKSEPKPMQKVGEMLKRHFENIVTFFRHRVTNGMAEGLNSKIMSVKRRACGYRNRRHFKTVIYFFCGGLNLYPEVR